MSRAADASWLRGSDRAWARAAPASASGASTRCLRSAAICSRWRVGRGDEAGPGLDLPAQHVVLLLLQTGTGQHQPHGRRDISGRARVVDRCGHHDQRHLVGGRARSGASRPLTRTTTTASAARRETVMAEGRSNLAIAAELGISERTVEAACAQVFRKLDLEPSPDVNRRVFAVLLCFAAERLGCAGSCLLWYRSCFCRAGFVASWSCWLRRFLVVPGFGGAAFRWFRLSVVPAFVVPLWSFRFGRPGSWSSGLWSLWLRRLWLRRLLSPAFSCRFLSYQAGIMLLWTRRCWTAGCRSGGRRLMRRGGRGMSGSAGRGRSSGRLAATGWRRGMRRNWPGSMRRAR